jgi:hypothetical protein
MHEPLVVDPHKVQDGRMEIMHVDFVLDRQLPELIGLPVSLPGTDPTPGKPYGKPTRIMVTACPILFGIGLSTEFTAEPNQGILQESAAVQVREQAGDGLIDGCSMV